MGGVAASFGGAGEVCGAECNAKPLTHNSAVAASIGIVARNGLFIFTPQGSTPSETIERFS